MLPLPGFVYFDDQFEFPDGSIGRKLFVVLCDSPLDDSNILVARTTTTPKGPENQGCHHRERVPNFFIPDSDGSFKEKTWVQFDYVVEMVTAELEQRFRKPLIQLTVELTAEILKCAAQSRFIARAYQDACHELGSLMC